MIIIYLEHMINLLSISDVVNPSKIIYKINYLNKNNDKNCKKSENLFKDR
jgi:hypothetical protein